MPRTRLLIVTALALTLATVVGVLLPARAADASPGCPIRITPTGRKEKIWKPAPHGTKCFGVVLVCYYCNYNENGMWGADSSEICGACVGLPF